LNLSPHIHLIDKSFSKQKAASYKLYLQISKTDIKITILDTDSNTFIGLSVYLLNDVFTFHGLTEPLTEFIKKNPFLQIQYQSINIAYVNDRATILPNAVFNKSELATYHQFNFLPLNEDVFFYDGFTNLAAQNIFAVPDYLINPFSEVNNKRICHFSTSLIEASLLYAKSTNALSLVDVHVLPNSFQILIIKNQQLELYNSFDYQTSEDFIYYLLFVLEQQKIDNKQASIRLLGEVEKNSTIYNLLYTYINEVTIVPKRALMKDSPLKLSYVFEDINAAFYYSLFQQYLCE